VGVNNREKAHAMGVLQWTDPLCTAECLGVGGKKRARTLDAILNINRTIEGPPILPARINAAREVWAPRHKLEFYVDFEMVSDLNDLMEKIPNRGGQKLIFMIGCGHIEDGALKLEQFTVDTPTIEAEERIISAWMEHMETLRLRLAPDLPEPLCFHWSGAEPSSLSSSYNAARSRHPGNNWPVPNWFDLLERVFHAEPVVVRGALNYSLGAIAEAMKKQGLITAQWSDKDPNDGLAAMAGMWHAAKIAKAEGKSMRDIPLIQTIEHYNQVDCRVVAEILEHLRTKH
jgi:hypothetical protein